MNRPDLVTEEPGAERERSKPRPRPFQAALEELLMEWATAVQPVLEPASFGANTPNLELGWRRP